MYKRSTIINLSVLLLAILAAISIFRPTDNRPLCQKLMMYVKDLPGGTQAECRESTKSSINVGTIQYGNGWSVAYQSTETRWTIIATDKSDIYGLKARAQPNSVEIFNEGLTPFVGIYWKDGFYCRYEVNVLPVKSSGPFCTTEEARNLVGLEIANNNFTFSGKMLETQYQVFALMDGDPWSIIEIDKNTGKSYVVFREKTVSDNGQQSEGVINKDDAPGVFTLTGTATKSLLLVWSNSTLACTLYLSDGSQPVCSPN